MSFIVNVSTTGKADHFFTTTFILIKKRRKKNKKLVMLISVTHLKLKVLSLSLIPFHVESIIFNPYTHHRG